MTCRCNRVQKMAVNPSKCSGIRWLH